MSLRGHLSMWIKYVSNAISHQVGVITRNTVLSRILTLSQGSAENKL